MRKIKKVTAVCLAMLLLIVSLNFAPALAADDKLVLGEEPDEILVWFAEEFAKKVDGSLNLYANDSVPIYDLNSNLIGYMISYRQGETPYGYTILNLYMKGLVAEYMIQTGANDIFTDLVEAASHIKKYSMHRKELIQFSPYDYLLPCESTDGELYYYNIIIGEIDNQDYHKMSEQAGETLGGKQYSSYAEVMYLEANLNLNVGPFYIDQYNQTTPSNSLISMAEMISETTIYNTYAMYACGVLALGEIAKMEGLLYQSDLGDTLIHLWTDTQTTTYSTENIDNITVFLGGTACGQLYSGMNNYLSACFPSFCCFNPDPFISDYPQTAYPSESFYTNAVYGNLYSIFFYSLDVPNSTIGHFVCVVGYAATTGSDGVFYVAVGDGWHNNAPRFIGFNEDFYNNYGVSTYGVAFSIH